MLFRSEGTRLVRSKAIYNSHTLQLKGPATAIIMPDDVAEEKEKALLSLGARVEKVRPASIVDKKQFVVRSYSTI